jgi:para-aminobenzoate synthetase / 4-amino-4-deoxychorismate lyase
MFDSLYRARRDPRLGVFETALVRGGRPVEAERHLERLGASLGSLYGASLSAEATAEMDAAAAGIDLGRARLTAVPGAAGVRLRAEAEAISPTIVCPEAGVRLAARQVRGGLGPDKLVDRPLGNRPQNGAGVLVVDGEAALEAAWANLFLVRDGVLLTPPLDGRILAGVARAAVIELARRGEVEVAERPLAVDELTAAEEVFLTNSVRGIEPATALNEAALAGAGPVTRGLADALRRRWGLAAPAAAPAVPATEQPPGQPAR